MKQLYGIKPSRAILQLFKHNDILSFKAFICTGFRFWYKRLKAPNSGHVHSILAGSNSILAGMARIELLPARNE